MNLSFGGIYFILRFSRILANCLTLFAPILRPADAKPRATAQQPSPEGDFHLSFWLLAFPWPFLTTCHSSPL